MKKLRIAVAVNDEKYGHDLMRRISELVPGIEFIVSEQGMFSDDTDFVIDDNSAETLFPVSRMICGIAGAAGERFRACLPGEAETLRTYVVRSCSGGAGCTAVGITIARILAARSGGRTAFVSIGDSRDAAMYSETAPYMFRGRELTYFLSHGMDMDIERYICEDRYGVTVLAIEKPVPELNEYLKHNGFSVVVTDAGNSRDYRSISCQATINIEAYGDRRAENFEQLARNESEWGSLEFYVLNKAPYRMADGRFIKIPMDSESFSRIGEDIEISMDKAFAASVRDLITMIESELDDEQSYFYK